METQFNEDFGDVRIHCDENAVQKTGELGARAFTEGRDITFARGLYAPHTQDGQRLLAHELAHVVQQRQSGIPRIQADDTGIQHVGISNGVPDFLNCEKKDLDAEPDTSCCSEDTLRLVPPLYAQSRSYTDRTLTRLSNGDRMDSVITRHFGAGALWHRDDIQKAIKKGRSELDKESSHKHLCRIALNFDNEIGVKLLTKADRRLFCSFNVLASARVGGNVSTLCVNAAGVPAGGWSTLLHEMFHLAGVGALPSKEDATPQQVTAGEYESYKGSENYPNPGLTALRNADSYSSFVEEVGAENWSAESAASAALPSIEAGPITSLSSSPRPGLGAGLLWTPFGGSVQMIVGARALWLPKRDAETSSSVLPTNLRAYAGPELGLRWIVGGDRTQFVLDVAGGGGPYVTVDEQVDPALAARVGLGIRFGGPAAGFGIGADFMKLFHFDKNDLVGSEADDWLGGLMLRGHWGGSSATPR